MVVNNELDKKWKEVVMVQFKVLFLHFPGGSEKTEMNLWEQPTLRPGFESAPFDYKPEAPRLLM
jgi:hypothetical protein